MGFDLVLTGMGSTDAEMSVMPSMVADRLGVKQATSPPSSVSPRCRDDPA